MKKKTKQNDIKKTWFGKCLSNLKEGEMPVVPRTREDLDEKIMETLRTKTKNNDEEKIQKAHMEFYLNWKLKNHWYEKKD